MWSEISRLFKAASCFLFQNSGIEKAFLFDVVSKIYIATDSTPVDMQTYELCCDMIDVVIDISCIYG
jgi:Ras-related GTP-binding protein C/D